MDIYSYQEWKAAVTTNWSQCRQGNGNFASIDLVFLAALRFYFPVTFLIKSTVGVLALLLLSLAVVATRRLKCGREILFLLIPPIVYLAVALTTGMNIGVRHVLIVYVFLYVLIGGGAQLALGDVLREMGQPQQARTIYEKALELAKTIEPEFQIRSIPGIEERLRSVASAER